MNKPYSQFRAMLAITRASLRAILRSPSAVIFSLGFPLIFILVFGFIGGGGTSVTVGLRNPADSSHFIFRALQAGVVRFQREDDHGRPLQQKDSEFLRDELSRGKIAAIMALDST